MTRVLVTGGAGFIGSHLVRSLLTSGEEVVVLDDLSTGSVANLEGAEAAELVEGSVLDRDLVDRVAGACDSIVHLAALASVAESMGDPRRTHEVNVTGTLNVLEAARRDGARHVVFASSAAVYGPAPPVPAGEGLAPQPVSPYASSKLAGEQYALTYRAAYGLPVTPLRFFNVFGPGQAPDHVYAAVVPAFLDAVQHGRPLTIHGTGEQTRDFIYVQSVVDVICQALREGISVDAPVNLAFGERRSLLELVAEIEQVVGRDVEVTFGPPRAGDVMHSGADHTRVRALFPDVVPVDLPTGLAATWRSLVG